MTSRDRETRMWTGGREMPGQKQDRTIKMSAGGGATLSEPFHHTSPLSTGTAVLDRKMPQLSHHSLSALPHHVQPETL